MTIKEFNQAVNEHADNVYRFVLSNIKDEDKAKDIMQDTYEKLWKKHTEVSFCKVKSYLFTTAYHTLIDLTRREKKQVRWEEKEYKEHCHTEGYTDLNEVLHQAIKRLPEAQAMVVMLRDYEGYSYKEISDISGLTEAQVKVYIYRARVFLKAYIGKIEVLV
ncbi:MULTISPECIES: RNA polymerase sigma factor [unclassified Carboxylicivirga]|uniref:RNA polymerase sigma factor n=1 Tax=Carboxylicivirga TaxID=1628153 RepID=UPI003D352D03